MLSVMRTMALVLTCLANKNFGRRVKMNSLWMQDSSRQEHRSLQDDEGSVLISCLLEEFKNFLVDARSGLPIPLKEFATLFLAFTATTGHGRRFPTRIGKHHRLFQLRAHDTCMQEAQVDQRTQLFESLLSTNHVSDSVQISSSPDGYRIVTTRAVEAGETLLNIPRSLLITAHRSGVIEGLQGQTETMWNAAGDLRSEVGEVLFAKGATWDVRLALGVFEACGGAGGAFWDAYRRLLPTPPLVTHLLTMSEASLAELQDEEMQARAVNLCQKLRTMHPQLDSHAAHPATAGYEAMGAPMEQIPRPLQYTYALVVSRCFAMSDGDTFAFVPFLDMANHAAKPTANFGSDASRFVVQALQPLNKGDEVSICYGQDYTTERLFEQYGFAPEQGTAQDWRLLREVVNAAASANDPQTLAALKDEAKTQLGDSIAGMKALTMALTTHGKNPILTKERSAAILYALGALDVEEDSGFSAKDKALSKAVSPTALLAAIRWQLARFPTSLEEDEDQLSQMMDAASGQARPDPRVKAVLGYRIARKRLFTITDAVLETLLESKV